MYTDKEYFKIQDAIIFLYKSFENVADRHKPELVHSLHVGYRLIDYGYPVDMVIAGFLHDVVEEGKNIDNLKKEFGKKVYDLVMANSKDYSISGWQNQYIELIKRTAKHSKEALVIKAVDVLDNFIFMFQTNNDLGKQKVIHLAEQVFKYDNFDDKAFKDLREIYKKMIEKV